MNAPDDLPGGLDEWFLTPDGDWYLLLRAVSYDSWLTWRDVFCADPVLAQQIGRPVFLNAVLLSKRIHAIHQLLPDYRRLSNTPFEVSRWWDPTDPLPLWSLGGACILKIEGYTAQEFIDFTPRRTCLDIRPLSQHWLEIALPVEELTGDPVAGAPPTTTPAPPELLAPLP